MIINDNNYNHNWLSYLSCLTKEKSLLVHLEYICLEMMKKITQMPVVLIPVHFDIDPVSRDPVCQRSVVIRPFLTNDFMTGVAAQPGKDVPVMVSGCRVFLIRSNSIRNLGLRIVNNLRS